MRIIPEAINLLAKTLIGGVEFSALKSLVADMENSTLSGEERRAKVKADFMAIGYQISGLLVDTALQLAIIYLRSVAGKTL